MNATSMRVEAIERNGVRIVACAENVTALGDALGLVAACAENRTDRLLIESMYLPPEFFELRTRFAGELLQKLQNYRIQVAAVFASDDGHGDRFREFLLEARRSRSASFRVFAAREEAEAWLVGD
jgi:hypothetical protein